MKLYFSIIATLVLGSASACEVYPNGPVDNRCVELRAQGQQALPAQPKYQSAQDRCTRMDGYGGNTNFACVPPSQRVGTGYEGADQPSTGEPTRFYTHSVHTPTGNYTIRGYTNGSTSTTTIYRTR
jgi:hypothetical protein